MVVVKAREDLACLSRVGLEAELVERRLELAHVEITRAIGVVLEEGLVDQVLRLKAGRGGGELEIGLGLVRRGGTSALRADELEAAQFLDQLLELVELEPLRAVRIVSHQDRARLRGVRLESEVSQRRAQLEGVDRA